MASYSTNEFKSGLKIILENDPYSIVENEMVKPGKGQAFNRVKVRNLKTGRVVERTFKSGDSVEAADVMESEMQYLYNDGSFWHFMVPDNFEQYTAGKETVGEGAIWLKANGQDRQSSNLNQMIWNVAEQVANLSRYYELFPGDIVYSGTPENVGPVVAGDVMDAHIDGLYDIRVKVV